MSAYTGDFLGFTYGGVRSSTLGITRVSDGSRFNENLLPTQQNRTVNVPGRDETYFFGSDSTQRQFNISYAFDSMNETQLKKLRALFGSKEIRDLKFDERGNITWQAKVSASSIKYIPFDENGQTIYKGEGTVQFTCYQPFGLTTDEFKFTEVRKNPTAEQPKGELDYAYYNFQDIIMPLDWKLDITFYDEKDAQIIKQKRGKMSIYIAVNNINTFRGSIDITLDGTASDQGVYIDSKSGLVEGWTRDANNKKVKSGNIYSLTGNVSKIPSGNSIFYINENDANQLSYYSARLIVEYKHY